MANSQTKQQAVLHHLRSLTDRPDAQARYALELLEWERSNQVVSEALTALTHSPLKEAHPVLLRLYDYYDAAGVKRDAGGGLRIAILGVLLPMADSQDQALAERAITTYEFLPPRREECASGLRAAGLVLLSNFDPVLASYHCAHLLVDEYTSRMSGEPAVSAVRLLAGQANRFPYQGYFLPLYTYLLTQHECSPEVEAECLRHLVKAPEPIIDTIISHYSALTSIGAGIPVPRHETKEEVVLLGFFDLLLAYPTRSTCLSFIKRFLYETQRYDVYQYVLTMIIASHSPQLWHMLLEVARGEKEPEKIELLLDALRLAQHDPAIEQVIQQLQLRKGEA